MIFCECHFIRNGEVEIEHLTFNTLADCLETLLGGKDGDIDGKDGENKTSLVNFYTIDNNRFFLEFRTC